MNYLKSVRSRVYFSAITTIAYSTFIVPINQRVAFDQNTTDPEAELRMAVFKLLFAVFFFGCTYSLVTFARNIQAKKSLYLAWLKYSSAYLAILGLIFILIYPGHWVWDEFVIFKDVQIQGTFAWQNWITNTYYALSLLLFPSAITTVVLQIFFSAIVVGYIIAQLQTFLVKKQLALLLFIPFLFFPVLINNFYPLRLTVYTYVEVLFICNLLVLFYRKNLHKPYLQLFYFSILIGLLSFWRSEGIYYLVFLPVIVYCLHLATVKNFIHWRTYVLLLAAMSPVFVFYQLSNYKKDPVYSITATVSPLSTTIQQRIDGPNVDSQLASIDKVLDLEIVRKYPSHTEIPSFWSGALRMDAYKYIDEYQRAVMTIFINNPDQFIHNRLMMFLATNSLDSTLPFVGEAKRYYSDMPAHVKVIDEFENSNILTEPWSIKVQKKTTQTLLLLNDDWTMTPIGRIVWNVIPVLIGAAALLVWAAIKRHWILAIILLSIFLRVALLFVAAPANYFMYYLPVYVSGYAIIFALIILYLDKNTPLAVRPARKLIKKIFNRE